MTERERNWIERIQDGDEEAFERMFRAYYSELCRFATEYVSSTNRARDVVQDVFLQIWDRRADWDVQRSLQAYLYRSVRNRALNQVRRRGTKQDVHDDLEYTTERVQSRTAEDVVHGGTLKDEVQQAIDDLPDRRRMAFLLHRRHGFTYKEIAQIMEITQKTVENQIGRALKSLREKLDPLFSRRLK